MCAARWSEEEALAFVRDHGLEPVEPYPGRADLPWALRHAECGRISQPRLSDLVNGQSRGCRHCAWSTMSETKRTKGQARAYPMMLAAMLRDTARTHNGSSFRRRCERPASWRTGTGSSDGVGDCTVYAVDVGGRGTPVAERGAQR